MRQIFRLATVVLIVNVWLHSHWSVAGSITLLWVDMECNGFLWRKSASDGRVPEFLR